MARAGLYKTEVKTARDGLLAQGLRPTIDAVRAALGHSGSKSTIHRYLKELEAEEGAGVGHGVPVSEALQHLVAQLAAQLTEEAETRIAQIQASHEAALTNAAAAAAEQVKEIRSLSDELQRTATQFCEEREAHATTTTTLQEARAQVITLTERTAGLTAQVLAREDQIRSAEEKHQQAREALEHFRRSAKEQRDQELQRHEHQTQALQVELRQAQDLVAGKNQELLELNRDNGRLIEQVSQADKALRSLQREHEAAAVLAKDVPTLRRENEGLRHRHVELMAERDTLQNQLERRESEWQAERAAWQEGQGERNQQLERLQAIETLLAQLKPSQDPTQGALEV
ncbi:DNA-binding protein [Dyella sp. LX-66]|uniref:DNA-binding protein n=1 Tax=unclassified Dyella TaxID=2634549 RepID=UPI001BE0A54C|nr:MULTISPECIES: DNA-binding protein [unclassified Dyella]MBT2118935.1 DNA-binding protein [Dyella sp. LX-1]MBT2140071.1 DNA-binding protein [Dyella sp. LX-66]